jgi:hypothetical protein
MGHYRTGETIHCKCAGFLIEQSKAASWHTRPKIPGSSTSSHEDNQPSFKPGLVQEPQVQVQAYIKSNSNKGVSNTKQHIHNASKSKHPKPKGASEQGPQDLPPQ